MGVSSSLMRIMSSFRFNLASILRLQLLFFFCFFLQFFFVSLLAVDDLRSIMMLLFLHKEIFLFALDIRFHFLIDFSHIILVSFHIECRLSSLVVMFVSLIIISVVLLPTSSFFIVVLIASLILCTISYLEVHASIHRWLIRRDFLGILH